METRQLQLHPMAIFTYIKAQAGSLGKAIAEMAMNSLDAFATEVHITLNPREFIVTDNGQGFRDKSEIAAWFETLGFPHDEGNHRTWGKFGLGRAQAWAFASTVWKSNSFVMDVDVKKRGLDYLLTTAAAPVQGTTIEGRLYTELPHNELLALHREVCSLLKYVNKPVFLNGECISVDPSTEKWDIETPEAWISLKPQSDRSLTVYNGGVLVGRYDRWRFQISGVVVTKPEAQLALNVARTDILVADCKVWPKIRKAFPATKAAPKPAQVVTSARAKAELAAALKSGGMTLDAVLDKAPDLLRTIRGRKFTMADFFKYQRGDLPVLFAPTSCQKAREIAKHGAAIVLDESVLTDLSLTPAQFREAAVACRRKYAVEHKMNWLADQLESYNVDWSTDPVAVCPWILDDSRPLAKSELAPIEQDAKHAWQYAISQGVPAIRELFKCDWTGDLCLGTSATKESWVTPAVGGRRPILILRKDFAVKAPNQGLLTAIPAVVQALQTVLQALAPAQDQPELLKKLLEGEAIGAVTAGLLAKTTTLRTARGTAIARTVLRHVAAINPVEIDELHVEPGSSPSPTPTPATAGV